MGTRLSGRWLAVLRVAFLVVALTSIGFTIASIPERYNQVLSLSDPSFGDPAEARALLDELDISPGFLAIFTVAVEATFAAACFTVGALIFWRRSDDWMALLVALFVLTLGVSFPTTTDALVAARPGLSALHEIFGASNFVLFFLVFFTFPNGRFVPRWTRYLALLLAAMVLLGFIFPGSPFNAEAWVYPAGAFFFVGVQVLAASAQIYRYWHISSPNEREKTRWVVLGFATAILGFVAALPFSDALRPQDAITFLGTFVHTYFFMFLIPLSLMIAILRSQLWDIDLIINRTLVYLPLTGIVGGIYAASVAFFQRLFQALTGERSDAAIIISTLIIASLFTSIRNRLQAFVDRHFKEAPDPATELCEFGEQVKGLSKVLDLDARQLSRRLLEEAVSAFQAGGGAVYLDLEKKGRLQLVHAAGDWNGAKREPGRASEDGESPGREEDGKVSVRLESNGVQLGLLLLGTRLNGSRYTRQDLKTLQQTADQVARAIRRG